MKGKFLATLLAISMLATTALTGCGGEELSGSDSQPDSSPTSSSSVEETQNFKAEFFHADGSKISEQEKEEGSIITLPDYTPEEDYAFDGWKADGEDTVYAAGERYSLNANTRFTAQVSYAGTPSLTFTESTENLTVTAGVTFTLPKATAEDKKDGNLDENILISANLGTVTKGEYQSLASGKDTVTYTVKNSAGKVAQKTVELTVTDATQETELENNDLSNLAERFGTYTVNFAGGDEGEIYRSLRKTDGTFLPSGLLGVNSTENAIAGSSLSITWNSSMRSSVAFPTLSGVFVNDSKYKVDFDIKLLSGTGSSMLYFHCGGDKQCNLSAMEVGETKHFSFTFNGNQKDTLVDFFLNEVLPEGVSMTILIDNMVFENITPAPAKVLTKAELEETGSYVYDWSENNSMNFFFKVEGAQEIVDRASFSNDALGDEPENFSEKMCYVNGNYNVYLNDINGIFEAGKTYRISFRFYVKNVPNPKASDSTPNTWWHWGVNDNNGQKVVPYSGITRYKRGRRDFVAEFTAPEGAYQFEIYINMTGFEGYIGNIKIEIIEPTVEE